MAVGSDDRRADYARVRLLRAGPRLYSGVKTQWPRA